MVEEPRLTAEPIDWVSDWSRGRKIIFCVLVWCFLVHVGLFSMSRSTKIANRNVAFDRFSRSLESQ